MAHTARGACWTSEDDMIIDGYRRHDKPVIKTPTLPSKPSDVYLLRDRRENAKNTYNLMCDAMIGLWKDGLDYTRAVNFAVRWLRRFNELNDIPEE